MTESITVLKRRGTLSLTKGHAAIDPAFVENAFVHGLEAKESGVKS